MKILNKQVLYTFVVGVCVGITALMVYIVFSGQVPFLKAAGISTGAADVNARYLDGYGTASTTASANKIYISDGSGYLPDNSIDTGAVVDGTIANADISGSAAIDYSKLSGVRPTASATATISSLTTACNGHRCDCGTTNTYPELIFPTCNIVCINAGYTGCYTATCSTCTTTDNTTYYYNMPDGWTESSGDCVDDGGWSGAIWMTSVVCVR